MRLFWFGATVGALIIILAHVLLGEEINSLSIVYLFFSLICYWGNRIEEHLKPKKNG